MMELARILVLGWRVWDSSRLSTQELLIQVFAFMTSSSVLEH